MKDKTLAFVPQSSVRNAGPHPPSLRRYPVNGFTLVELLTVVALISLLSALLFPAFATSHAKARRMACTSNLKQIGLAFHLYRQDYDGALPVHVSQVNQTHLRDARVLICPSDIQRGQIPGNDYFEGNNYLPGGVSYEYFPQWQIAQNLNWYDPSPDFGDGKWGDMTPLVGCPWHWAKSFSTTQSGNSTDATGWELVLTLGGSVRKIRIEEPINDFTPAKYH